MFKGTTILYTKVGNDTVLIGDGQVTLGNTVMKHRASKVRRIFKDKILVGFAGATADAFTLFTRLEGKLEQYSGNLERAVVELAKDWRTDKYVIEPDEPILAIGSGGPYAYAAAKALCENSDLSAEEIARKAMTIASEICIYTNNQFTVEKK